MTCYAVTKSISFNAFVNRRFVCIQMFDVHCALCNKFFFFYTFIFGFSKEFVWRRSISIFYHYVLYFSLSLSFYIRSALQRLGQTHKFVFRSDQKSSKARAVDNVYSSAIRTNWNQKKILISVLIETVWRKEKIKQQRLPLSQFFIAWQQSNDEWKKLCTKMHWIHNSPWSTQVVTIWNRWFFSGINTTNGVFLFFLLYLCVSRNCFRLPNEMNMEKRELK